MPAPLCKTGAQEGLAGPTWAPDGERLAFAAPDGIWTLRATADCGAAAPALLIPGASQPDWGPAPVAPGPRANGSGGGSGGAGGGGATGGPTLAVKRAGAKAIARKGLAVAVACPAACTVKAELLRGPQGGAQAEAPRPQRRLGHPGARRGRLGEARAQAVGEAAQALREAQAREADRARDGDRRGRRRRVLRRRV